MAENNYLISGESFDNKTKSNDAILTSTDNEINNKYIKGDIRIVTEQARYPLDSIPTMLDSKKYILNPEYQRRKRWDNTRKSRLIESFIMNVPIPPIFLYEYDYSSYEVMDGLQRLTAIDDFYKGVFALENLEYWKELNGKKYHQLPTKVRLGVDRRYLSSIILLQETAKNLKEAQNLKRIVFERLNSGGEKLTPQETRNALNNGKFNQMCIRLAKNDLFRKMWQMPLDSEGEAALLQSEPYRKMEDVELVLRFFAYRHIDKLQSNVDTFLDTFLKVANEFPNETIQQLEQCFIDTIQIIYDILGEKGFFLPDKQRQYKTPVKTIYDPIMQGFAMNIAHQEALRYHQTTIRETIYKGEPIASSSNKNNFFDGRYSNRKDVQERIQYFDQFLKKYINIQTI
jgi:Protein of unknown function DUF262